MGGIADQENKSKKLYIMLLKLKYSAFFRFLGKEESI